MGNMEYETADKRVGLTIRAIRSGRGMSQEALGEQVGEVLGETLGKTVISKIEGGKRPISFVEAVAIMEVLHTPIDALVKALEDVSAEQAASELRDAIQVASASLSPEQVWDMLNRLAMDPGLTGEQWDSPGGES